MKIGNDEVKRVTSFAQLRPGIIVYVKPCDGCGVAHRGILTGKRRDWATSSNGVKEYVDGFTFMPSPKCMPRRSLPCVAKPDIDAGIVYRVVDPLLDAQTTERKRETVRG